VGYHPVDGRKLGDDGGELVTGCGPAMVRLGDAVDEMPQLSVQDLLMIPAHDRVAGTLTVTSRAEVRIRGSWEPRSRVLIRPVPSNPLD
jgi:hypothetical protein